MESEVEVDPGEAVALAEALVRLEQHDPRAAEVTRLRFFAGLSVEETASALGLTVRTVHREWTYARARLRNRTDGARVLRIEPAALSSDAYFDALTVRVHANGPDFTITDEGKVVSGDPRRARAYTEYWTLIRGRNVARPTTTQPQCPQCGAALQVSMAGDCEHCDAKITSGEFDWVLSRIEQDEEYAG